MRRRLTDGALLTLLLPRLTADRRSFLVIGAAALAFAYLSLDELASSTSSSGVVRASMGFQ